MSYPASDITSVNVTAGTSSIAANKSVSCSSKAGSTICVVWGVNSNVISNGTLASATFQLASSTLNTSEAVQVTNVVASTGGGLGIPASGVGSTISVTSTSLWSISGGTSAAGSGATVTLSGAGSASVTADASGNYSFSSLANGTYTVTPSKSGYTFSPANKSVTISGANVTGVTFTAALNASPDFTLSASPSSQTVTPGGSTSYSVAINPTGGFGGPVTLSVSGLPTGGNPSWGTNPASTSSTFTVATSASTTPAGTYTLTIKGVSGTLTHSTTVTLVVGTSTQPDFTLSASPSTQTVAPGASTSYSLTISPTGGFSSQVTFISLSGLPSGTTGSFTPNPATASSTLSVVTTSTPAGTYTLTITGSGGGLTHTATVSLVVSTAAGTGVTYDNKVQSGIQWSPSTKVTTPPFIIGSGANRAAMIMITMSSNNSTSVTASLGGVAGTLIPGTDSGTAATLRTLIFQVINPPSGSQAATVTWSKTKMYVDVGVITVSGADQNTPCTNGTFVATNSTPAQTTSVTITSNPGDLTASVGYTANRWMTPFTSQMLKWGIDSNATGGDIGHGLGNTTHMWTGQSAGESRAVSGANFRAATAGLQTLSLKPALSGASAAMRRTENSAQLRQANVCSPGGLSTLSGKGFTTQDAQKATSFPLPERLAGVQVLVNGAPAPLLFVSDSQVNFQCPLLPPGSPLEVSVEGEGGASTPLGQSAMEAVAPGLFTVDASSQGVVLLGTTNEIAMPKTNGIPGRPARKGEFVTIYANGLGEVTAGVPIGTPAPLDRLVSLSNKVSLIVGGVEIEPAFAGLASGTAGLFQVNAQLPQHVPIGPAIPLYIKVILADGSVVASNTVSMAIDDLSSQ